jgi:hypothetical protein
MVVLVVVCVRIIDEKTASWGAGIVRVSTARDRGLKHRMA